MPSNRLVDPLDRVSSYGARRSERWARRRQRNGGGDVGGLDTADDDDVFGEPEDWTQIETVEELPEPDEDQIGRLMQVRGGDGSSDRIVIATQTQQGTVEFATLYQPLQLGKSRFYEDDFENTRNWGSGGNGSLSVPLASANHPGLVRISTGGTSGNQHRLFFGNSASVGGIAIVDVDLFWIVRVATTNAGTARFGLANDWTNNNPDDGIWIAWDSGQANWQFISRSGNSETAVDSGVATSANWMRLRMRIVDTAVDETVYYSIDDGPESEITTTLPASSLSLNPGIQVRATSNNNVVADADYFRMLTRGMGR